MKNRIVPAPLLSIVVIGRNEGARLVRCLESVRAGNPLDEMTELIYVDSCSTDGSPERATALGAWVITLPEGRLSAARARNAGWRAASASLILFLDGDGVLDASFIESARAAFCDASVAAVFGNLREVRPDASIYHRVLDLEWMSPIGWADFCGGNAMMRRAALEQADGFDAGLIAGEEPDLCRRMRAASGRILHIDAPMVLHDLGITRWSQYWKHAVRAGHAYAEVSSRYRKSDDPLWTRESRRNLLRGPFLMLGPLALTIGCIALRSELLALCALCAVVVVVVRTAWRARWRSESRFTLLLFSVHSHVQQIPIFWGQVSYWWGRIRNRKRVLIEYKAEIS